MGGQIFAGTGLGILLGLLVGLSASPVVSTVVAALSAGLIALLGFSKTTGEHTKSVLDHGSMWRLGSFGFACAIGVLLGLLVRTNNILTPAISKQISQLTEAGYSPIEARQWVARRNFGGEPSSETSASATHDGSGKEATPAASVLFASPSNDDCQAFDPDKWKDSAEQLRNLEARGGRSAAFARNVKQLNSAGQAAVLMSAKHLFCAE